MILCGSVWKEEASKQRERKMRGWKGSGRNEAHRQKERSICLTWISYNPPSFLLHICSSLLLCHFLSSTSFISFPCRHPFPSFHPHTRPWLRQNNETLWDADVVLLRWKNNRVCVCAHTCDREPELLNTVIVSGCVIAQWLDFFNAGGSLITPT